jgi:hypothetical protein
MNKRYATVYYPGVFMSETETVKVGMKTTAEQVFKEHPGAFQVQFYTKTEIKQKRETLTSKPKYEDKTYIKGKAWTLAEMKKNLDPKEDRILISNVEINRWKGAIQCVTGNWQPWTDNMVVIK